LDSQFSEIWTVIIHCLEHQQLLLQSLEISQYHLISESRSVRLKIILSCTANYQLMEVRDPAFHPTHREIDGQEASQSKSTCRLSTGATDLTDTVNDFYSERRFRGHCVPIVSRCWVRGIVFEGITCTSLVDG